MLGRSERDGQYFEQVCFYSSVILNYNNNRKYTCHTHHLDPEEHAVIHNPERNGVKENQAGDSGYDKNAV
jgi:hypothetical protein